MIKLIPGGGQGRVHIASNIEYLDFIKTNVGETFLDYLHISANNGIFSGNATISGYATIAGNVGVGTLNPDEKFEVEFGDASKDVEIGVGTTDGDITFITLRSPNGTKYYVTVDDIGTLVASTSKP